MQTAILRLTVVVLVLGFFQSCKKESKDTSQTKNLITSGTWIITDLHFDGESMWDIVEDCIKDNEYIFHSDNSYSIMDGAIKCDTTAGELLEVGSWFVTNNSTLSLDDNPLKIVTLNSSTMVLSENDYGSITEYFFTQK
jgi:hypothetical protein